MTSLPWHKANAIFCFHFKNAVRSRLLPLSLPKLYLQAFQHPERSEVCRAHVPQLFVRSLLHCALLQKTRSWETKEIHPESITVLDISRVILLRAMTCMQSQLFCFCLPPLVTLKACYGNLVIMKRVVCCTSDQTWQCACEPPTKTVSVLVSTHLEEIVGKIDLWVGLYLSYATFTVDCSSSSFCHSLRRNSDEVSDWFWESFLSHGQKPMTEAFFSEP